ncbi:MAG: sigma-54 dependent transcriptional regulator [Desulfuromonadales bacterium]|nr:sigma-54 dependent transcriptional regulator [Desulfuromonadales bacterium]
MDKNTRLLYVDDEAAWRNIFRREISEDKRYEIKTAAGGAEALSILESWRADVVLTDLSMPEMDGIELLQQIQLLYPGTFVLILTGVNSANEAVRAMKAGAYDYVLKPFDFITLQMQLARIIDHQQLAQQEANEPDTRFEQLIGQSPSMYQLFEGIRRIAPTNATVLIRGESGTGKELVAAAIHSRSSRRDQPFVPVNCAALTESLINSALFGHEKGAFTGADKRKIGFFEHAHGGTIFLDEIGDIPLQTQVALLRVLELGTFQRVGGTDTIQVDTRIICATNKNLETAIREKTFREDLFYRLNVVALHTSPLRNRATDIPLLAIHFLRNSCAKHNKQINLIAADTLELISSYAWPGNVRELKNAIDRAVVFSNGNKLLPEHLPPELLQAAGARHAKPSAHQMTLASTNLPEIEAAVIRKVLEDKNWNLSQAAEALGIARGTLYSKIKSYNIQR